MIKAVLLDLDDTLITTRIETFFPTYLQELGKYLSHLAPPDQFVERLMVAFYKTLNAYEPSRPLYERLIERFAVDGGFAPAELESQFAAFYDERYGVLRPFIQPRPESHRLLKELFGNGLKVAVATNPGLPITAIQQRMAWGDIEASDYPFALITSLEEMHFGKPSAEYYAEIALRLDVEPGEAIMVGDSWEDDIVGAAEGGLHTYWVTESSANPPDPSVPLDDCGPFAQFVRAVEAGWLGRIGCEDSGRSALMSRLAAYPAALDALRRPHPREVLECCPGLDEWSARDIVCHLRDYELDARERQRRILDESDPFLSANLAPWAAGAGYQDVPFGEALGEFVRRRAETLAWLRTVPGEDWARSARDAIFGPTTFLEMVGFLTEHDRTHLHQMHDAIEFALSVCASDEV